MPRLSTSPLILLGVLATVEAGRSRQNPLRKTINMLQMMEKKLEEEAKNEKGLFDKFMCGCQTSVTSLEKSIEAAETKIPQLESSEKEMDATKSATEGDIAKAKEDRADAEETLGKATAIRQSDEKAYAKEAAESSADISAVKKALAALKKEESKSFLQTKPATVLRTLSVNYDMSNSDRDVLSSFLQSGGGDDGNTGEIVGILDQMQETMVKDYADINATEATGLKQFNEQVGAKEKEVKALNHMVEKKTTQLGEVGVDLVNTVADLEESEVGLVDDKEFLLTTKKDCDARKAEYDRAATSRKQEQLAIAETIKVLNDDDAQGLFKKTVGGSDAAAASFLQVSASATLERRKRRAAHLLRAVARKTHSSRLGVAAIAIRSQKGFDKIVTMIDEMVALLHKEQKDDDSKKTYCHEQLDQAEDTLKELKLTVADAKKSISKSAEKSSALQGDIEALKQGIEELDAQVAEATGQRKGDHEVFVEDLAANNAAKELLGVAKNRLNKFYNPKLYKAPAGTELVQQDQVVSAMGGDVGLTQVPGGVSGQGTDPVQDDSSDDRSDDESNEDADDADDAASFLQLHSYRKMSGENSAVTQMLDSIILDIEKQVTQLEMDDEEAQKNYEAVVQDSAKKRKLDAEAVTEKEGFRSELEEKLHKMRSHMDSSAAEAGDKADLLANLHTECDWLLSNHDVRSQARQDETDALKKAKGVLLGAT